MSELSHVGMTLCFYCGESRDVVLDKRLKATLPREAVYDMVPCDNCQAYMQRGVILIAVQAADMDHIAADKQKHDAKMELKPARMQRPFIPNPRRTGQWLVVSDHFIQRNVNNAKLAASVLKARWAFIPEELAVQLMAAAAETEAIATAGDAGEPVAGGS